MSDDLVAFIRARLAEDEMTATRANVLRDKLSDPYRQINPGVRDGAMYAWSETSYDPARVLREVEAIRAILKLSFSADENEEAHISEHGNLEDYKYPLDGERIRRHLAGIWRDHPDYDPAWGPG